MSNPNYHEFLMHHGWQVDPGFQYLLEPSQWIFDEDSSTLTIPDGGNKNRFLKNFASLINVGTRILITPQYQQMFDRIERLYEFEMNQGGYHKGVMLSGQPGIGKTIFQRFMLWKALFAIRENFSAIAFCVDETSLLIHEAKVYLKYRGSFKNSWEPVGNAVHFLDRPLLLLMDLTVDTWPVHHEPWTFNVVTSSPREATIRPWLKGDRPLTRWGLAVSEPEILKACFKVQAQYPKWAVKRDELVTEYNQTRKFGSLSKIAPAFDTWNTFLLTAQEFEDRVFHVMIRRLGPIQRSLFRNLETWDIVPRLDVDAISRWVQLQLTMELLNVSDRDFVPRSLIIIHPHFDSNELHHADRWTVDFLSDDIRAELSQAIRDTDRALATRNYWLCMNSDCAKSMGGLYFEHLVHSLFSRQPPQMTPVEGSLWQLVKSESRKEFTYLGNLNKAPARSGHQFDLRYEDVRVETLLTSDIVPNIYYRPQRNFSLIDSFAYTDNQHGKILWLFRITVSAHHDGSDEDYDIIKQLSNRLDKDVEKNYVLIVPADASQATWVLPGPEESWKEVQGAVYCLKMPF